MKNNILFDNELSDNEQKIVYVIDYNSEDRRRMKMAIYCSSIDEASRMFRQEAGEKACILKTQRMTEAEYKEKI